MQFAHLYVGVIICSIEIIEEAHEIGTDMTHIFLICLVLEEIGTESTFLVAHHEIQG